MEDTREDAGPSEPGSSNANWWPSGLMDKLRSVSLAQEESLNGKEMYNPDRDDLSLQTASQILWTTGTLSGAIPNGFYSVIPEKKLKEHFDHIPSPEEIHALGLEGFRADIILVDGEKDKKLSLLKNLMVASVRGSNPAAMIKKIAGLVSDFYKRPASELSPAKAALEDNSHFSESRGVQLLGQIKNGLCRPRAILFKVLADTVGLESRLVVGLPTDGAIEHTDSYKHMSVIVVLNSVELLVDLMRFPGQLIPYSSRAVFMSHISAAGESDSAENDSCDSPLEPNSPLYGFSDRADVEGSPEQDDTLHCLYQRKFEASSASGSPARNIMLRRTTSSEGKLSPEHPLFRGRGRSMLSGSGRQSFREYADDLTPSRSDGTSTSETRRIRRRSISITPEIGDDIVRAVRAMNETLKQNRLLKQQGHDGSVSNSPTKLDSPDLHKNLPNFSLDERDKISSEISGRYSHPGKQPSSQTAVSLPSSPRAFRGHDSERSARPHFVGDEFISTWNKVLESSTFLNKPLLPFQEWNIDYSELTVGTRVGIGFFGEVFRGIWNGTDVAIKVFLEQDLTAENMEDFCNEISILSRLRHPNVILFLGACTRPPHLSMVTEYMEMGSLYYLIHMSGQKKKLSLRRRLKMLRDICRGLMCIHRMKIVHRDVKSANCLVNKHYMVKICDFGLSRVMAESPMRDTSSAGTPEWMAPELIRNEPFTEKCDVFSLGVIMWELCTLNRPWEGVSPMQVVYAVANEGSRLEIPEGPLGKLIQDCWAEPDDRPSCEEILTRLLDCEYALC
ncbi:serine/threonine-protein kinase EDR1-like isoform X3 [Papaver somniferum]|uniref:serine/threonine-protein kinase EDR1-like isoform X3 n=1 Tax=Papaver somniferum TaxID=3469 RepID=UPI000E6FC34C|nr:serine/threonine-protein kinase EDR1-like isoform X3 [Papaver somniferum]